MCTVSVSGSYCSNFGSSISCITEESKLSSFLLFEAGYCSCASLESASCCLRFHSGHVPNPRNVVDELILKFTHSREIDYLLPGVAPTGKYVELPHVVVMKFVGDKIAHEHIYWDQASLLAQIGLLDTNSFPVKGIEQSRKLQELVTGHGTHGRAFLEN